MSAVNNLRAPEQSQELPDLFEPHFAKIASTVATLVLLVLAPLSVFLGTILGYALQQKIQPKLKLAEEDKILTTFNSSVLIVGAFASVIQLTPAGALGGFLFRRLPLISSFSLGDTMYRFVSSFEVKPSLP